MSAWTNWAGNQTCDPVVVGTPRTAADVVELVERARHQGRRVKAVGAGHSFTGIAVTDGVQVDLSGLSGVINVDRERRRVRVGAGTPLHVLNPALEALGLALPNLGDIDRQSIAGAISTGTHGTGAALQGIAAAVTGLTLVTSDGSVVECSADEDPALFHAARVSLGALGIITEVELQCVPPFQLHAVEGSASIGEVLDSVDALAAGNDHVDIHWFPHTDRCLLKRNNRVEAPPPGAAGRPLPAWRETLDDRFLANTAYEQINRLATRRPGWVPRINKVSARVLGARQFTDTSWKVFCSPRDVRFTESEYAVPRASLGPVMAELMAWIDQSREPLPFPVEIRFTAADDVWLSTAYERDNAYVAVHQFHRMDGSRYFAAFEAIVREHAGRPHWGKLHTLTAEELRALYPRFDDFLATREQVDPGRTFANDYLDRVLGP
ncbi:MAG TPA: D-arabinono-1,4-lactone oxidase [Ornithinicoccus sp.]|nr:D-arabinono-1,4-lactone oxidase [Ornithinicoccus sp.]